jgi:hypothetical protein
METLTRRSLLLGGGTTLMYCRAAIRSGAIDEQGYVSLAEYDNGLPFKAMTPSLRSSIYTGGLARRNLPFCTRLRLGGVNTR